MTINERLKYLGRFTGPPAAAGRIMRLRYVRADRPGRTQLLDEMAKVTDLERKTLIRLLHGDLARHPRQKQRGRTYGALTQQASGAAPDLRRSAPTGYG